MTTIRDSYECLRQNKIIARQTGIPTTKAGIESKIGKMILKVICGK